MEQDSEPHDFTHALPGSDGQPFRILGTNGEGFTEVSITDVGDAAALAAQLSAWVVETIAARHLGDQPDAISRSGQHRRVATVSELGQRYGRLR